jgi:hypothetical protein
MLTVTVAMGYDEDGNDLRELPEFLAGLRSEGFTRSARSPRTPSTPTPGR